MAVRSVPVGMSCYQPEGRCQATDDRAEQLSKRILPLVFLEAIKYNLCGGPWAKYLYSFYIP